MLLEFIDRSNKQIEYSKIDLDATIVDTLQDLIESYKVYKEETQ